MKIGYVYILSNRNRTTLYIGVTSNLQNRILHHKLGNGSVFTKRYQLYDLLYYEIIEGIESAIKREKQLKNWKRQWKMDLIETMNPSLTDLANEWFTDEEMEIYRRADSESSSE